MRAFIPSQNGIPINTNFYAAWLGFREMGVETVPYYLPEELDDVRCDDVVVGGIGSCQEALRRFDVEVPHLNYPESLRGFLGRKVWPSTIGQVSRDMDSWPVFVKSVDDKLFTGIVVRSAHDLVGCGAKGESAEAICSEVVDFVAEWRCFVRYGSILDVRPYNGEWRHAPSVETIERAVASYTDAPAGYGIDFGLTKDGRTLLVEVNDGYALGSYGLQHNLYAQLLTARWKELLGLPDPFAYISLEN